VAKHSFHKTDAVPIGTVLETVLRSCQTKTDGSLAKVWDLWADSVGTAIAQNAKPAAFKQDILLVHVSSSVWLHHLQFLKQDLITKLNSAMDDAVIKDIKFKIGTF
jgi:predicted nucleic acid-binding Zn ribbon protein